MKKTNQTEIIDCYQCKHFYVTWEPSHPRGCKAFGFKTHRMPSTVVFENSEEKCLKFSPKRPEKTDPKKTKRGWIA